MAKSEAVSAYVVSPIGSEPCSDDEQQSPTTKLAPACGGVVGHFTQEIQPTTFAEFQLLILTFCTGIQDATTFPDYHCFASNQTGNTVFLCVAMIMPQFNGDMFFTSNIGVALGVFLAAGWLTGQLSHLVGPRQRWWLVVCNLAQTLLVLAAAIIQYCYGVRESGPAALGVLALLASAAGSQVVQSRSLAITEISTAMATAAWVDLMIDQHLFALHNRPRTRRVAFLVALVGGSLVGAAMYKNVGSAAALAASAAGKFLVTLMFVFSRAEKKSHDVITV